MRFFIAIFPLFALHSVLAADTDGDGLDDSVETNTGVYVDENDTGTDPTDPDSDLDGVPDGLEITEGTNPNNTHDFNAFSVGVTAYYPFNGNANDESGNARNLVPLNGATLDSGKDHDDLGAYSLDGQNDYLQANKLLGDTTSLTISAWVKPAALYTGSSIQNIFSDADRTAGNDVRLSLESNNILSGRADKGSDLNLNQVYSSSSAEPGKWTHVTYTTSQEGPSSIYVNGIYSGGSETGGRNVGYHTGIRIGLSEWDSNAFNGKIDSVRYYERALSSSEVAELYYSEVPKFQIIEGDYSWSAAKADAEARGGRLAVLDTQEKIDASVALIMARSDLPEAVWIGASDSLVEGEWRWINGALVGLNNWSPNEPSGDGDYAMIWGQHANKGEWNDSAGAIRPYYLLEILPLNVPLAPVLSLDAFYESNSGESITIDATPTAGYPTNFTYQWYFNGNPIPAFTGGTGSSFTIDGISEFEGSWKVRVTNTEGYDEDSFEYRVYVDTDGDGLSDGKETIVIGSNPELRDSDSDGLSDKDEWETYQTSPILADTDSDGFDDAFELSVGFDPNSDASTPDTASGIMTAVEFWFNAADGASYRIEVSDDLQNWSTLEDGITGTGGRVDRLYSIREQEGRYFRARRN